MDRKERTRRYCREMPAMNLSEQVTELSKQLWAAELDADKTREDNRYLYKEMRCLRDLLKAEVVFQGGYLHLPKEAIRVARPMGLTIATNSDGSCDIYAEEVDRSEGTKD